MGAQSFGEIALQQARDERRERWRHIRRQLQWHVKRVVVHLGLAQLVRRAGRGAARHTIVQWRLVWKQMITSIRTRCSGLLPRLVLSFCCCLPGRSRRIRVGGPLPTPVERMRASGQVPQQPSDHQSADSVCGSLRTDSGGATSRACPTWMQCLAWR
eukprot:2990525-Prymnesium_polylepis.1